MKFYRTINVTTAHIKAIDSNDIVINTDIDVYSTNPTEIETEARAFCAVNNIDFIKIVGCTGYTAKVYFTLEKIINLADKIERSDAGKEGE